MDEEKLSAYESSEVLFEALNKPIELWDELITFLSCNNIAQGVIKSVRNILV